MDATLAIGIILFAGFALGEIMQRLMLPRVTGYILAGVLLNPGVFGIMPAGITAHTDFITNISLSFITFSIGGTLVFKRIRALGRSIVAITIFEAETTFVVVSLGVAFMLPLFAHHVHGPFINTFLPVGLLIGALASPTDPTGTLAVVHQYRAKGDVTSTILGVSAFDDALGLLNFSLALVAAKALVAHEQFSFAISIGEPLVQVIGAVVIGCAFGMVFNLASWMARNDSEGVLIVVMFALLGLCFSVARALNCDELLATMMMGVAVSNTNRRRDAIFEIFERYAEEIVFVIFFTLSGMYLNFGVLATAAIGVILYTVWRTVGKFAGTWIGATVGGAQPLVRRYTACGLIPAGGIIIGLALLLKQVPSFSGFADIVLNVIIGATVIHEIVGPVLVQLALRRSGEIVRREIQ